MPVGGIFSLPPYSICLAGGISIAATGTVGLDYSHGKVRFPSFDFAIGTGSYGYSLDTLGIRSYF